MLVKESGHRFGQPFDVANVIDTYSSAKQRLLLFDYDGTLTPIIVNPAAAILSPGALMSIQKLAANSKNTVWIISGRNQSFLETVFGHSTDIGLVAEHGSFVRQPRTVGWENLTADIDMSWQEVVSRKFQWYTNVTLGSYVEKKRTAVVWHFRHAIQDYAAMQAAECKKDLETMFGEKSPVEFINGKCVLEARLKIANKGETVGRLVDKMWAASGEPPGFTICFGDDVTDEDMFRALYVSDLEFHTICTVSIGELHKDTDADWVLPDPTEVLATIITFNRFDEYDESHNGADGDSKRKYKVLPVPRSDLLG